MGKFSNAVRAGVLAVGFLASNGNNASAQTKTEMEQTMLLLDNDFKKIQENGPKIAEELLPNYEAAYAKMHGKKPDAQSINVFKGLIIPALLLEAFVVRMPPSIAQLAIMAEAFDMKALVIDKMKGAGLNYNESEHLKLLGMKAENIGKVRVLLTLPTGKPSIRGVDHE
jgi:hypothetical protein